ncbi:MAG: hypothetical protein GAK32_02551 [Pseudomonas fluorescens]|nr:MAG: hypothetical protein GAK32_02551 [Pseudomonas fluorescens]
MRWACIVFPQLALDGVLRTREAPEQPLVLLAGTPQRRVLQTVNEAARQLGLRAGQSLTAAHALTKAFACADHDPAEIERWQQFLAAWAYGFSSQVSVFYPRALLFEIESSLSLFGPWPQFEARLRKELTGLGFRHRIVAAPNPAAARVLANAYDGLAGAMTRSCSKPWLRSLSIAPALIHRRPRPCHAWACVRWPRCRPCHGTRWPDVLTPRCSNTWTHSPVSARWP